MAMQTCSQDPEADYFYEIKKGRKSFELSDATLSEMLSLHVVWENEQ